MDKTYLGVIEGYYGKSYQTEERTYLLDFMSKHGYQFYIYAPKEDLQLRDKWDQEIDEAYTAKMSQMSKLCHDNHLDFGIALSPLNLTATFEKQKELIIKQVQKLCSISNCEIFCLLFDDMHKTSEDFGAVQNKIIQEVEKTLPDHVKHFIICPSYYTYDPVLERIFGTRPKAYFEELMKDLPERVEVFWTGEKVLSEDITREHLEEVTKLLGRKPFIWDNYPVNDGRSIHQFLFLNKFKGRRNLQDFVTGHAVNPMVQCVLSTLAEITLPLIYKGESDERINQVYLEHAKKLFGKAAHEILNKNNLELLTKVGTDKMTEHDRRRLLEFCNLDQTAALEEIKDFLKENKSDRFDRSIIDGTNIVTVPLEELEKRQKQQTHT